MSDDARIKPSNRVLLVGMNGSGKSELAAYLFSLFRVRRLLIDPKGEWQLVDQPCHHDPDRIDWDQPLIHYQPRWRDYDALHEVYQRAYDHPDPLMVWTDEAYGVSSANQQPNGLLALQVAGRSKGKGHMVCTQRPRNIGSELRSEADHIFIVRKAISTPDLVATLEGAPFLEPHQALKLYDQLPQHGYVWIDRARGDVALGDPLPSRLRGLGPARKRST